MISQNLLQYMLPDMNALSLYSTLRLPVPDFLWLFSSFIVKWILTCIPQWMIVITFHHVVLLMESEDFWIHCLCHKPQYKQTLKLNNSIFFKPLLALLLTSHFGPHKRFPNNRIATSKLKWHFMSHNFIKSTQHNQYTHHFFHRRLLAGSVHSCMDGSSLCIACQLGMWQPVMTRPLNKIN